jgi:hypothetical protein
MRLDYQVDLMSQLDDTRPSGGRILGPTLLATEQLVDIEDIHPVFLRLV